MKDTKFTVFTDFDGTITRVDTLNMILDSYATKPWHPIEDLVTEKKLPENKALQAEFDLVNASFEEVLRFVKKSVRIDRYFIPFADWCKNKNIPLIVISGGFREIIELTFNNFHIDYNIEIHSNSVHVSDNKWKIIPSNSPKIKNKCNHCKTYHLLREKSKGRKIIFIGDGNTDRCPAEYADVIFAKNDLSKYLRKMKKIFYSYNNFSNILKTLNEIIAI